MPRRPICTAALRRAGERTAVGAPSRRGGSVEIALPGTARSPPPRFFFVAARFFFSPSRKTQSKKLESKKPFFDCVRKPDLGLSRKRPFLTKKSDCTVCKKWPYLRSTIVCPGTSVIQHRKINDNATTNTQRGGRQGGSTRCHAWPGEGGEGGDESRQIGKSRAPAVV